MAQISVVLNINSELIVKDPQQTELGQRIVREGIVLIDKIGFESFTFKKLAKCIGSTEASIYRYFKNKHLFFVYLINWYWEWTSFRISFNTMNLTDAKDKLRQVIHTIVDTSQKRASVEYVNTDILHRIVVTEGTKAYHGKYVDKENKMGFFLSYKALCKKIALIISEVNSEYPYSNSLASMLIETANNNIYFAEHLPRLTDIEYSDNCSASIETMLENMIFSCLLCDPATLQK
jgi:hypothetical protein